jgi:SAM-dependent methyltransferase
MAALLSMASDVPCVSRWDPVIAVPTASNVNIADRPAKDAQPAGSRWSGYHARDRERSPRPLLLRACGLLGAGGGRMAVDLGCSSGTDALALLNRGWAVTAVDQDETGLGLLRERVLAASAGRLTITCGGFADVALPPADLVHAGFSLPFCAPGDFAAVWKQIREALLPGGVFAGQLFGLRDSWAGSPLMSFHGAEQVRELLDGTEVLSLSEAQWDGEAVSGAKHWHVFDVMFRRPLPAGA